MLTFYILLNIAVICASMVFGWLIADYDEKFAGALFCGVVALWLSLGVWTLFVAGHFITKYW